MLYNSMLYTIYYTLYYIIILYTLKYCIYPNYRPYRSHYKMFGKLNTVERSSEDEDEDWITEEIVDVEHNKVYTREVAIWSCVHSVFIRKNMVGMQWDCAGWCR